MTELAPTTSNEPTHDDLTVSAPAPVVAVAHRTHHCSMFRRTTEEEKWLNDQPSLPKRERGQAIHARHVIQKFAVKLRKEEAARLQSVVDALGIFYPRTKDHAHERDGLIGQFGYHCAFAIGIGEKASRAAYVAANHGVDPLVEVEHALQLISKPFDITLPVRRKNFADEAPQPGAPRADITRL